MNDARYALRGLLRTPGFTAVAILSLARGIGANVTIYSVANTFLARPIAGVADPDGLVRVYRGRHSALQYRDLAFVRDDSPVFANVIGEQLMNSGGATPTTVKAWSLTRIACPMIPTSPPNRRRRRLSERTTLRSVASAPNRRPAASRRPLAFAGRGASGHRRTVRALGRQPVRDGATARRDDEDISVRSVNMLVLDRLRRRWRGHFGWIMRGRSGT